jgi:hypothetical protein
MSPAHHHTLLDYSGQLAAKCRSEEHPGSLIVELSLADLVDQSRILSAGVSRLGIESRVDRDERKPYDDTTIGFCPGEKVRMTISGHFFPAARNSALSMRVLRDSLTSPDHRRAAQPRRGTSQ